MENELWNTDIDSKIINWTEEDKDFTIYRHECTDKSYEYYINEQKFVYTTGIDGVRTKNIISGKIKYITQDNLINLLAEPTIVRISGYKGETPESSFTLTVDSKNAQIQVCDNTFYDQYSIIKTLKNWINRKFKLQDMNCSTLIVKRSKLEFTHEET